VSGGKGGVFTGSRGSAGVEGCLQAETELLSQSSRKSQLRLLDVVLRRERAAGCFMIGRYGAARRIVN